MNTKLCVPCQKAERKRLLFLKALMLAASGITVFAISERDCINTSYTMQFQIVLGITGQLIQYVMGWEQDGRRRKGKNVNTFWKNFAHFKACLKYVRHQASFVRSVLNTFLLAFCLPAEPEGKRP